jgi:hypothetical protein
MENGGRKAAVDFIGQIPSTIKTINQAVNSTYNYYPPVPESPRPWEQIYPPLGTPSP